ncbi:MAG: aminotransferase class III-fold pyridoxal phosphate-dependent enzyme, partial [Pirellulales bacterium]
MNPVTVETAFINGSERLLERGKQSLAGGDSSTMRVLPYALPLVADRASGSHLWDVDGHEFLDMNMAYGPLLFGHRQPFVVDAVIRQISEHGSQLGFPTEISMKVAENVKQLFPSMELMRFSSSGTEAIVSALRLARCATGRSTIIAFEGNYHGSSDGAFHRYHAPLEQLPACGFGPAIPGTMGMNGAPHDLIVCRAYDVDALQDCVETHADTLAGIILEPVQGNCGVIAPPEGFLHLLREITLDYDAMLIFDEVITGMRIAPGGAQQKYEVTPDITTIAKVLGGGYPGSAFGASRELMEVVVDGTMFHGGVYSGNAACMAAANAMLERIIATQHQTYPYLYNLTDKLAAGLREVFARRGIPCVVQHVGPLLSL